MWKNKTAWRAIWSGLIAVCVLCIATFVYEACGYCDGLRSDMNRYYDRFCDWSFRGNVSEISKTNLVIAGLSNNTLNVVGQEFIPPVSLVALERNPDGKSTISLSITHFSDITDIEVGDTVVKLPGSSTIRIEEKEIIVSADSWRYK